MQTDISKCWSLVDNSISFNDKQNFPIGSNHKEIIQATEPVTGYHFVVRLRTPKKLISDPRLN